MPDGRESGGIGASGLELGIMRMRVVDREGSGGRSKQSMVGQLWSGQDRCKWLDTGEWGHYGGQASPQTSSGLQIAQVSQFQQLPHVSQQPPVVPISIITKTNNRVSYKTLIPITYTNGGASLPVTRNAVAPQTPPPKTKNSTILRAV